MAQPLWLGRYIGLPFTPHGRVRESGVDCWGLIRLVYLHEFGIQLPCHATDYPGTSPKDVRNLAQVVEAEAAQNWHEVRPGDEDIGDVVVLRVSGHDSHVGVVVGDRRFLHIIAGINSTHESYRSIDWRHRVSGFFRYAR